MQSKISRLILILVAALMGSLFFVNQPVVAAEESIYPIDGQGTINLGDQGLFISQDLTYTDIDQVKILKLKPPLLSDYTYRKDITYYAPALDITFMNAKGTAVKPGATISSIFFNIDEDEVELWNIGGPEEISIWYYEKIYKKWEICPTRYIPEKQNNGKFDRLACFIMGNGIYVLGKVEPEKIENVFPTDRTYTINLGKQGLFISNPPPYVDYVKVERIQPPLPAQFTFGIDFAYRGPALEITFLNVNKAVVKPGATLTSVYFNISEPEVKMWENGGSDEIAIWYYNESSEDWRLCSTRYLSEMEDNQLYDRLACFVMGNGFYVLGKMEFDPVFPLWFKLQGQELERRNRFIKEY